MNKFDLKKRIKEMIQSDSELKKDYDILSKNKIGYMTNKVNDYLKFEKNRFISEFNTYYIANSDENTKEIYSNIINHKLKSRLKQSFNGISDADFGSAMREAMDDLAGKSD